MNEPTWTGQNGLSYEDAVDIIAEHRKRADYWLREYRRTCLENQDLRRHLRDRDTHIALLEEQLKQGLIPQTETPGQESML